MKEVADEVESLPRHQRGINLSPFSPLAAQRDAKNQGLTQRRENSVEVAPSATSCLSIVSLRKLFCPCSY